MEQRRDERKTVSMDAVIACARFGLIRGRIIDLGMGGGYVRAETSIVPIGSEITVTFQPDTALCSDCLTISGRVSHQSLQGFGIEFRDLDDRCQWVLENFLPGMPAVPERAAPVLRAI